MPNTATRVNLRQNLRSTDLSGLHETSQYLCARSLGELRDLGKMPLLVHSEQMACLMKQFEHDDELGL